LTAAAAVSYINFVHRRASYNGYYPSFPSS
jgi:hypothetical protein